MKVSDLIKRATDYIVKYGDGDIRINLLTENQPNFLDEEFISVCDYDAIFKIEIDIDNKQKLMNKIK